MSIAHGERFLALGDSYTIGEGVAEEARWPNRLARALTGEGVALAPPEIIATTGWTTDELKAGIAEVRPRPPFALASLLIGVNNQYRGRSQDNYRTEFAELLAFAIDMTKDRPGRVLVVSIPDWGVTAFAQRERRDQVEIASEIDAFNAIGHEQAEQAGCAFVDITGISRACGADPAMLADDGLHPSAEQYARWLPPILAAARRCLARD